MMQLKVSPCLTCAPRPPPTPGFLPLLQVVLGAGHCGAQLVAPAPWTAAHLRAEVAACVEHASPSSPCRWLEQRPQPAN